MNGKPKVSIVVPVCNVENYLKECMDSILAQTLKEIEIICVNDGSTDNSLNILKDYEKRDSRIRVITKENSGYGNTMNVGMEVANGEYIGIVESDDYIESNMFERLYRTACQFDVEIVKSDHYIFSTKAGKQKKQLQAICPEQYYGKVINGIICPELFDFSMMNWTGIYKRQFIENNNIRHNETPGASFQDNGFWFQVMTLAKRVVLINEAFYYYRQDNPNSSINRKEKVFCICDEYSYIQDFLESNQELATQFYVTFFTKKVFNYLHFYHKASSEFKLEFLYRITNEIEADLKNPYIDREKIDPWIFNMANRIVDSPELFFYEDSQWELKELRNKTYQQLIELRNSKECKKGLKFKERLLLKV